MADSDKPPEAERAAGTASGPGHKLPTRRAHWAAASILSVDLLFQAQERCVAQGSPLPHPHAACGSQLPALLTLNGHPAHSLCLSPKTCS